MYCTKCGKQLPDRANFCNQCGSHVSLSMEPSDTSMIKPQNVSSESIPALKTNIDHYIITENCTQCGLCVAECPVGTISESKGKYILDVDECISCGLCLEVCPANAIRLISEIPKDYTPNGLPTLTKDSDQTGSEGPYGKKLFTGYVYDERNSSIVYEKGIEYKKKFFSWDEIDAIYYKIKNTVNYFISYYYGLMIIRTKNKRVVEIAGPKIAGFELGNRRDPNVEKFDEVYDYIVSKIMDRQWSEMNSLIAKGREWRFDYLFSISKEGLKLNKFFAKPVSSSQIVSYQLDNGALSVMYSLKPIVKQIESGSKIDGLKTLELGNAESIPNLHIIERFLLESSVLLYKNGVISANPMRNVSADAEEKSAKKEEPRWVDNGDGTITDSITELTWQKVDDGVERDYHEAIKYCKNLSLAGRGNWRLPTLEELQSIVVKESPANMDPIFSGARSERYWTITEFDYILDGVNLKETVAYTVDFGDGNDTTYNKTNQYFVRAVCR